MKFDTPKSQEETDKIILTAKQILSDPKDEDIIWSVCKQLIIFAGSFNHNISRSQREEMLKILTEHPDFSIGPVLDALVELPRAEQYDLTILYIRKLAHI